MRTISRLIKSLHLQAIFVASLVASCGGGGGGGGGGSDSNYAGNIAIDIERDHIDSGDLNNINIEVVGLNPDGSILKIRLSKSLSLVRGTPLLFAGRDEERQISVDEKVSTENENFLVFFLYPQDAINGDFVSLSFKVKGMSADKRGFIEVDLDNNDPSVSDKSEFDPNAPRFTAKERRSIYVDTDTSEPTPTPTPSGTETPSN
jgi:hypothetical protein